MADNLLKQTEEYVLSLLNDKVIREKTYHNPNHTKEVTEQTRIIGKASGLSETDMEIVTIAALFHDTGYTQKDMGHEEVSAKLTKKYLTGLNYPEDRIKKITGCILATKVPQHPKNILEEVLCDADLHHLGSKNFFEKNDLYRQEYEQLIDKQLTEEEWLRYTIGFFRKHKYFTLYAKENFQNQKNINLRVLEQQLTDTNKKAASN